MSPLIPSAKVMLAEDAAGVRVQSELALYSNAEAMKSNKKHGWRGSAEDAFALCFC